MRVEDIFRSDIGQRDKFLAHFFAFFSEEAIRCWCSDPKNRYADLGRPRVMTVTSSKLYFLDFTFRERSSGRIFLGKQKFWPEYQDYRFLRIDSVELIDDMVTDAFEAFLNCASTPDKYRVWCGAGELRPSGSIFVTGAITDEADEAVRQKYGFHEILSFEQIIEELRSSRNSRWEELVEKRLRWSMELFDALGAPRIAV